MKILIIIIFFSILLIIKANAIEYGYVKASDILSLPEFKRSYEQFQIPEEKIEKLAKALKDVKIEVFLGDWCPDSAENVPPFIKIIEKINLSPDNVFYINVPKEKDKRPDLLKEKKVERLPTFIFYKKDKEIGRIIEHPLPNLIDNIINLLLH